MARGPRRERNSARPTPRLAPVSPDDDGGPADDLFVPVTGGRISDAITHQIRTAILSRRLQPGDRLPNERELAERFGVSRVTVRDALRTLEAGGLLEIRVGASGGPFVTAPSTSFVGEGISQMLVLSEVDPDEIAEARLILELGTVALAVERATDADIDELRRLCAAGADALAAGSYETQHSRDFHAALAVATHNRAIEMVTATFAGPLSMIPVREREPAQPRHERTVAEHLELVEAIAARDGDRARDVMHAHLTRGTGVH
jgi:GntR family transcriptional regulator, transcriptional repressor for pyruvate dehydrogenase complex